MDKRSDTVDLDLDPVWDRAVHAAAEVHPTPFYIYRSDLIEARADDLRAVFPPGVALQYAVKTNPNPSLLRHLEPLVERLDVSSAGEMRLALAAGWPASRLRFTGPAKSDAELAAAVAAGIGGIVIEHPDEARDVDALAASAGRTQDVLLRISPAEADPGFSVRLGGKPDPFGIAEEDLDDALATLRACTSLRLRGFHIYSASQSLQAEALAAHFRRLADLFGRAVAAWGAPVDELIFGAGLGIPYHPGDEPLALSSLRPDVAEVARSLDAEMPGTALVLELGRYLVGEAGLYVTRVTRTKTSRGVAIALCDGGMNHNMSACGLLGGLVHKPYRIAVVRPEGPAPAGDRSTWRIAGPLCTTVDTIAHRAELPALRRGDLLALRSSGGYGPSASPLFFIAHAPPRELLVTDAAGPTVEDVTWLPAHDWQVGP
ncbi:type III PLP-dependent enzyme [Rhodobacterales bacterium HKCCE3408]|nr:type III PLP-dependent enzyme [Rhodobacterales bacterium HKCCE3408]